MRNKILEIVTIAVNSLNNLLDKKIPIEQGEQTLLYGASGILDSLSLVNLIVAIEEGIENELGISIILASEKAMSEKRSPFSSVGVLVDYIEVVIKQETVYA